MDLDEPCGEHFRYRDLVACGETWSRLTACRNDGQPFDNVPREPATFAAMRTLCAVLLDPVVEQFGRVELTYAFASAHLVRNIPGRIHPPGDQHAGHELRRTGQPVCPRLGFAVDFVVPGVDSREVLRWVVEHTAFDRLYFHEPDRPLHVSVGPDESRQVVHMQRGPSGRRVPRVMRPPFDRDLGEARM